MPVTVRSCLAAICDQFENFRSHKIKSGDGWEALFIITRLLTKCLTKRYCKLVPLERFDCEVSWKEPFDDQGFLIVSRKNQLLSISLPMRSSKSTTLSSLAGVTTKTDWLSSKRGQRHTQGFCDGEFVRSLLPDSWPGYTTEDSSISRWSTPSDDTLDQFFGESAKYWSPKCWAALKNSDNRASVGNGEPSP
eukprot:scaffold31531_cov35-Attheya_sp.AAC.4